MVTPARWALVGLVSRALALWIVPFSAGSPRWSRSRSPSPRYVSRTTRRRRLYRKARSTTQASSRTRISQLKTRMRTVHDATVVPSTSTRRS
jgi:hypothetical protein